MTDAELFRIRIALLQVYLRRNGYDGILLSRVDNFAMATGGKRNYVYIASEAGVCSLFVTKEGEVFHVGNNIESTRVPDEELAGLGCGVKDFFWFNDSAANLVRREFRGTLVSDDGALGKDVNGELTILRALLTETELEKYRKLGALAADAMTATLASVEKGTLEADIAARLVAEGARRRCIVPVFLVAADERIAKYRHPLATEAALTTGGLDERPVRRYVMVVGCFLREGLVASITRFKAVDEISNDITAAYARICGVDALMQEATEPGRTLGDVFAVCQKGYRDLGFPDNEWHNHHQGGSTGYAGRTCKGTPGEAFPIGDDGWRREVQEIVGSEVRFGNAFAWNPSAVGVKSEDTFILTPSGRKEIVTLTPQLPRVDLDTVLGRKTDVVKSAIV